MECRQIIEWVCSRGHRTTRPCAKINGACQPCNAEDRAQEAKKQRNMMLEVERERRQKEYMKELTELQDEIAHERRLQKDEQDREQRKRVLQQHRDDLANLRSPKPDNQSKAMNMATETITPKQSPAFNKENDVPSSLKPEPTVKNQGKSTNKPEPPKSAAKDEWEYQKNFEGAKSAEIDTLMEMIGLEEVKEKFITIKDQVDTTLKQGIDLKGERFGSVLRGNPGTGKTTFARLYSKFLGAVGVLPGSCFVETTGSELANEGVSGCQKKIEGILKDGGGVMFIDEAYQLAENNIYGIQVINFLLGEVEKQTGKVVFVLAGYRSHMEKFFEQNPGLPSRFPHEFKFEDYDDDELRQIFEYRLDKKYNGRMKIEGGRGGLFSRIVARRVGRGRGKEGFGNARAIENVTSLISQRQANRLARERRSRRSVDVMFLTKNDLIGPEPSQALRNCSAWQKLKKMIGLDAVKKDVQALLDSIQTNYERELLEKKLVEFTLNRVFLGSPGTGKTSVAKLYGQILVDIGLLSNGEVIVKNPADFVGSVLGESERNTKGILASTVGKVLVIDEAYMLSGGGSRDDSGPKSDPYKTAVVDTIVSEVHSVPGDDRCVLLLGYQEQMEEMFRNVNPGLTRRFPLDSAFMFEDFTDDELGLILDLKLEQQDFETTTHGRKVALEVLARARNRANFGNAGEVDILLNKAKIRHQKRVSARKASTTASVLVPEDFDEHHDRGQRTETNIPMLFADVVGSEKIVEQLEGYRRTVMNMQLLDLDPRDQVAFNFLFRGPPGTGKTTTARKMGKVYYDMGLLASAEVIESSATDLIGQYVGKTGPKTQALLEKALGKVLLIDEAYRLAEGAFAKEAMDEIVDCITKPKFEKKLIIILAGYDGDINRLMTINPGLTSRFPHSMEFNGLNPDDCFKLLTNLLQGRRKKVHEKGKEFDISALEGPTSQFANEVRSRFSILSQIPNWANARDVQTLAKAIFGKTMQSVIGTRLAVEEKNILAEMDSMITDRTNRSNVTPSLPPINLQPVAVDDQTATPTETKTSTTTTMAMRQKSPERQESLPEPKVPEASDGRDAGVTNEIWNQLLDDKRRAELEEEEYQQALKDEREAEEATRKLAEETRAAEKQRHDDDEAKRRHEQDRLQRELERRIREEKLERLRRKKAEMEAERKKEQQAQQKLRDMGVCCMGYRWIKQSNGYRCAGGSHFVSNAQLGF
ncbi:hypothetical protein MW887_006242 [Aspergillus wentii]|nr:hypothetical protein MW887_006242 [Aspergillus wentii]